MSLFPKKVEYPFKYLILLLRFEVVNGADIIPILSFVDLFNIEKMRGK